MSRTPRYPAPGPLRLVRYIRLVIHLLNGLLTVAVWFPILGHKMRCHLRMAWARNLLAILGVRLETRGVPVSPGALLVANHVSWLDIYLINALQPVAFVSKAEVRDWPVIGWLARSSDTIFLHRGSRGHARQVNAEIAAQLERGHVAVFPEGTTTDGTHVLHFHAALLQPALDAGHPVQPLAVSYHTEDGARSLSPAYDGDITLGECLAAIIGERRLVARVTALPALESAGATRKAIAENARNLIQDSLSLAGRRLTVPVHTGSDEELEGNSICLPDTHSTP
ncbi:MAG: 1-acyl-sn-glycerol-3-phosphate acyltransferase [Zoogloea sp.]|nr:1-acyl-sn-glycerol-3-phosphate acyltransferase [Zoogloea sp.]